MKFPILLSSLLLVPACGALASDMAAAPPAAEPMKVPSRGFLCKPTRPALESGETHACYFLPEAVGGHDFSTRNARVLHVITELGPHCDDVELLGETAHPTVDEGKELRRVSVACVR